ncbi:hypothetical protein ACWDSJ_09160 [Nocardia sp. NPDC003482]
MSDALKPADNDNAFEIRIGAADVMEDVYKYRLMSILAKHGSLIEYVKDRATIDLGLHFYRAGVGTDKLLGSSRIWMQCKGINSSKLSKLDVTRLGYVPVKGLNTQHIAYWYAAPEPVYLVAYVESLDDYFLQDARRLVDEQLGSSGIGRIAREHKTTTLKISLEHSLKHFLDDVPSHQSVRIDDKPFRGRALGHGIDPLRSSFKSPEPKLFEDIALSLLNDHGFEETESVFADGLFANPLGALTIHRGILHSTYEWTSPFFTQFGFDEGSDYRVESRPLHAQGDVVVIIHSEVLERPRATPLLSELIQRWTNEDVVRVLVMFNAGDDAKNIGAWRSAIGALCVVPQGMDSLSYNILTSLTAFRSYFGQLEPSYINYR